MTGRRPPSRHALLAAALLALAGARPALAAPSSAPEAAGTRRAPPPVGVRVSTSASASAATRAAAPAAPPAPARAAAGRLAAREADAAAVDLFARRSWAPPPPPPPKPAPPPPPPPPAPPPPPPKAPPLPFTFVGFIETDGGGPKVLLALGDELIVARRGDELAGRRYRLANVTGSALEFVYLPLQQAQSLQLPPGSR